MPSEMIYVFFGLIASGKSTLAELLAAEHGIPYLNTDRVRKELAGIAATERCPNEMNQGIYCPELTAKTYQALLDRTEQALKNGAAGVVLDGSYSRAYERDKVRLLAQRLGANVLFVFCSCSEQETRRRLEVRALDPNAVSDGRWEIFVRQQEQFQQPDELPAAQRLVLDTAAAPSELLRQIGAA